MPDYTDFSPSIVISAGMPMLPGEGDVTTGDVYFVSSTAANRSDSGSQGKTPTLPFATIDYAIGRCTANVGDRIYVMPGYTQTSSAAAGIDADVAGVTIKALGFGTNRATITFTDTAGDIDIDAANITLQNFRFIGNVAALAAPIDVNAAFFSMLNCDFYCAAATTDINMTVITDANADDMLIYGCNFNYIASNAATAATVSNTMTEVIRLVGADRAHIIGCFMNGNFTTACINGITTASRDIQIIGNRLHNVQTTNIAGIIDLVASCDGIIAYNQGFHGYTTDLATTIDPAGCAMIENYFSNVVTESGGIVGTRST